MLHMTFYWGKTVTILFDTWRADTWLGYLLSLLALLLASAFYQYLEDRRIRFKFLKINKTLPSLASPLLHTDGAGRHLTAEKVAVAVLFGINSAIGYMLMLAVMSFNGGVFLAVVLGLAVGYLGFRCGEDDLVAVDNSCACA